MIDRFLDYLRYERNSSALTIDSYDRDLTAFEMYFSGLDSQLTWKTVDADIVRGWIESLMDKGNAASSINRRLSALRSFYRFALARHLVEKDPAHAIKGPKKSKPLPQFLRETEMDALLDVGNWTDTFEDVRARAILMTFYETGIRLSELLGLQDGDIDFGQRQLKVTGKRNKQRIVPFGEELTEELQHYIVVRNQANDYRVRELFQTDKGTKMKAEQVRYLVKKYLSRVTTLKKRSPHVLRHTFATAMLNHEAGLESVQKLLGHESLETTEIYTHTTFEQLKRVYKHAHPRA